ncbi:LysR substrate-binding domain-containing protein [Maribacter ulvicola]|uniref:DNA-binding transcriptional regulator, LysR family n=1 Tax=Maribacter ulvicola TaxID=228959 RepID=A0A1N6NIG9_9FLAO|nr:LysR substrate-binding domain-containing protein [Maribacter ulvicola]SIP91918.1 DNA-binding transcriptional regulator, LysR family [Maribacter ulvicola]
MTTQQIKYFLVLAGELHFWKASEKVYVSQSTLSRQIQSLEQEIGIKLFERDKRNVKLTDAGKFLQEKWTVAINELDHIQKQAKKIDQGTSGFISISYPGSIAFSYLPLFLNVINEDLPDLKLELTEPTDERHEKLLLNYETDIAFNRDVINNIHISSFKINTEPICLVTSEKHWLTEKTIINLKDLKDENFIIAGLHKTTYFSSLLRNLFLKNEFEPKTVIESDFGGMILNLVAQELGISILPYSYKFSNVPGVQFIELNEKIDLFINWRKTDPNKTTQKVIELAKTINSYKKYKSK